MKLSMLGATIEWDAQHDVAYTMVLKEWQRVGGETPAEIVKAAGDKMVAELKAVIADRLGMAEFQSIANEANTQAAAAKEAKETEVNNAITVTARRE